MSSTHMFGVVLWTSAADKKAVIWCEDQGNLAFYSGAGREDIKGVTLDAGDLIQFDIEMESDLRKARNPQLVGPSQFTGIAQRLRPENNRHRVLPPAMGESAAVIYLDRFATRRNSAR